MVISDSKDPSVFNLRLPSAYCCPSVLASVANSNVSVQYHLTALFLVCPCGVCSMFSSRTCCASCHALFLATQLKRVVPTSHVVPTLSLMQPVLCPAVIPLELVYLLMISR